MKLRVCVLFALAAFVIAAADSADAGLFKRMRGGCCKTACCEPEPCCAAEPVCEPEPCCEAEPVCCDPEPCCEPAPCCRKRKHCGLFARLRNRGNCCEPAADCGCETASDCGCADGGEVIIEEGIPVDASPADVMPAVPEPPVAVDVIDESA